MTLESDRSSRREFVTLVSAAALSACASARPTRAPAQAEGRVPAPAGAWDLSWIDRLATATDRAVFDWPSIGDPADPIVLELAERYLDNCAAAYAGHRYVARVVLNIRTQAVPAALTDAAWERFALGAAYTVKDPTTQQPAVQNPFWHRAPSPVAGITLPTLEDLVRRGAIVLVCDFALGHLSKRLATTAGRTADEVHRDLLGALIPGAFAVPSGIFGLARAQNAGCAYVRV